MEDQAEPQASRRPDLISATGLTLHKAQDALRDQYAHVLRPAFVDGVPACPRCRGPVLTEGNHCASCTRESGKGALYVGILNYMAENGQAYSMIPAYKNLGRANSVRANSARAYNRLSLQLFSALMRHGSCSNRQFSRFNFWTPVPSSRSGAPSSDHPLYAMAAPPLTRFADLKFLPTRATNVGAARTVDPARFELLAPNEDLLGAHVLVIEDLWVSGSSVNSLAEVFRAQGALVTALALGRYVSAAFGPSEMLLDELSKIGNGYDPEICPWNPRVECMPHPNFDSHMTINPDLRQL